MGQVRNVLEIWLSCEKLLITGQNKWKLTIVNQSDKKVILNCIKTQKVLAFPMDDIKTYSQMNKGRRSSDDNH